MKEEWELNNTMSRLKLRQISGREPQWKFTKKNGKLSRGTGKGIDWWRYQQTILIPLMFPFARNAFKPGPARLFKKTRLHLTTMTFFCWQQRAYDPHEVSRLWCGNSPDLNAIEAWSKRTTTRKGAPKNCQEATTACKTDWTELPQEKIQAWVERDHIQKIIELEGGNEYKEGRDHVRRVC